MLDMIDPVAKLAQKKLHRCHLVEASGEDSHALISSELLAQFQSALHLVTQLRFFEASAELQASQL